MRIPPARAAIAPAAPKIMTAIIAARAKTGHVHAHQGARAIFGIASPIPFCRFRAVRNCQAYAINCPEMVSTRPHLAATGRTEIEGATAGRGPECDLSPAYCWRRWLLRHATLARVNLIRLFQKAS